MIQTSESSISYVGNNSMTTPYPVPFVFNNDEDLVVVFVYPTGDYHAVLGTDYTATGKGNPDGGSITTLWSVGPEAKVSIVRNVPYTQLTSYEEGDSFPAKSHERALDKLTMEVQQVSRGIGTGTGLTDDLGTTFRLTDASGGIKSLSKANDTLVGIDANGDAILRTPTNTLSWLGQVGTSWANSTERANTRGAFAGQTGVQRDNWTIYVARSTEPGDWVPHLKESGVVISTNGTPTAKPNPAGDIVGTDQAQVLTNKTLNACAIHNPTGLTAADVGLGNVDNTSDEDAPVSIPQQLALQQKQDIAVKGFAQGYASLDAAGKVPIEQIPSSLIGGNAAFQTSWNAATNTPTIPAASAANNGFYYLVAVAGTTTIDGISSWAVGDTIISDGAAWKKITAVSAVSSVAGKVGVVTLVKGDVGLSNVDNTSVATQNAAVATLTNKTIKGSQNSLEVRLDADVINNLPTARLNGGTGAAANTWWCGDGTWKQPQGTGDVTGVASSVDGELPVFADTGGKHIRGFAGAAGFVIATPGNAVTTVPKIGPNETDPNFVHGLTEKLNVVENDELVIWDSVTGQLMKVLKKNLGVPPGSILDYAGATLPAGYLLCDGATYLKATYPALAAALGTTWGAGDATHFVVPDFRGYVAAGKDDMGGTNAGRLNTAGSQATTVGGAMGAQTHTLTLAQLAQHGHNHQHNTLFYMNGNENGNFGLASINAGVPGGVGFNGIVLIYRGGNYGGYIQYDNTQAGSNGAHNNIQPTRVCLKIIKY